MANETEWLGKKECGICAEDLSNKPLVDGATFAGPWTVMCDRCHKTFGVGLGTGLGQRYVPDIEGKHVKVPR